MILLRLLSWQYVRKHQVRSLLTTAGIALGVAVFVGMHAANRSILAAFGRTVDRIAGATELQVTAGEAEFDEEVLELVQQTPEVRLAVPIVEAVAAIDTKGQGNLLILGVDMVGDRGLRDYSLEGGSQEEAEDPLVFLAQPDSLIVSREFAGRNGLSLNSRTVLRTIGWPPGVYRSRPDAIRRAGLGIWGQPRRDGHLRHAEGIRTRAEIRPDRPGGEGRRHAGAVPERARTAAGTRIRRSAARGPGPAVRIHDAGLLGKSECFERLCPVHRAVHHLQFVLDRGDPTPD